MNKPMELYLTAEAALSAAYKANNAEEIDKRLIEIEKLWNRLSGEDKVYLNSLVSAEREAIYEN